MWTEIDFPLKTEKGTRHLVLKSNYRQGEDGKGLFDDGNYSVYEDLTPFDDMSEEEIDAHYEKAAHWDAGPYMENHGIYLGMLHVNLTQTDVFIWDGKPDDLTVPQQAQIVEYLTTTDFDPDVDYDFDALEEGTRVDEKGFTEVQTFAFQGLSGLQPDGSIHFIDSYKTNAIRIKLVPVDGFYKVYFEEELVGEVIKDGSGQWLLLNGLFKDDALTTRIGEEIDRSSQ